MSAEKKSFQEPEIEVETFAVVDIVTESGTGDDWGIGEV